MQTLAEVAPQLLGIPSQQGEIPAMPFDTCVTQRVAVVLREPLSANPPRRYAEVERGAATPQPCGIGHHSP
jgi:hypothetical protein